MDKFVKFYENNEEKNSELSEYVHQNFKLIMTKMTSEMRRMLDIIPDLRNSDGYLSLILSLQGRMFNEMIYSLCGVCQSTNEKLINIISKKTLLIFLDLLQEKNVLNGLSRTDVPEDLENFKKYYMPQINELRKNIEALPKKKNIYE